ncbi:hypothetical protein EDB83DRAFT_2325240 [Lactarius deliciosus]|nr:hypothetical protein EDB83DRAFT_2325240 [Lactarius deliciosus]
MRLSQAKVKPKRDVESRELWRRTEPSLCEFEGGGDPAGVTGNGRTKSGAFESQCDRKRMRERAGARMGDEEREGTTRGDERRCPSSSRGRARLPGRTHSKRLRGGNNDDILKSKRTVYIHASLGKRKYEAIRVGYDEQLKGTTDMSGGDPQGLQRDRGGRTESEAFVTVTAGANANGRGRERAWLGETSTRRVAMPSKAVRRGETTGGEVLRVPAVGPDFRDKRVARGRGGKPVFYGGCGGFDVLKTDMKGTRTAEPFSTYRDGYTRSAWFGGQVLDFCMVPAVPRNMRTSCVNRAPSPSRALL